MEAANAAVETVAQTATAFRQLTRAILRSSSSSM